MPDGQLVSVIIPAFNAADTIDATLRSVRAQTHRQLEILVVDDGSNDNTAAIVEAHARLDGRIRLLRQQNAGVAAARNWGISEAKGEFVAPIDADDLWRPTKIEKELALLLKGGPDTGLAYSWQAEIDEHDDVIATSHRPIYEGNVFIPMLTYNLVGSGSNALMRRHAVLECGGYDPSLRARGGEGCEDLILYILLAERYRFAVVREHLTGYRRRRGSMSTKFLTMLRSRSLVDARLRLLYPEHVRYIRQGYARMCHWLLINAVKERNYRAALPLGSRLMVCDTIAAVKIGGRIPLALVRRVAGKHRHDSVAVNSPRRRFLAVDSAPAGPDRQVPA
ncbi:MAG: glycosyl transferase family 2 [Alphaproteobacteria bacterium]|nr:glycosyl transferase family 2 [Alphaproteobacteria bacterium]